MKLNSGEAVIIRPATLSDLPSMTSIASRGYLGTPFDVFVYPRHHQYPNDSERGFQQLLGARFLNPRNVSIVAVLTSAPSQPIAYAQFIRLGNDSSAKRQIASRDTYQLRLLSWFYWARNHLVNYFWPDRSADPLALREFYRWRKQDDETYWSTPEQVNRWHAQSVVVAPEWQRKGVGKLLMSEVLRRARKDGVFVGLEATMEGERLYRSLGFRLLGGFCRAPPGMNGGGVMIWDPDSTGALSTSVEKSDEGAKAMSARRQGPLTLTAIGDASGT
ncbi:hypothetical protein MMC08_005731 [Hypocenomyce scalaris]|nr:hypothetical protein [Hypocenomyce scalaris]